MRPNRNRNKNEPKKSDTGKSSPLKPNNEKHSGETTNQKSRDQPPPNTAKYRDDGYEPGDEVW